MFTNCTLLTADAALEWTYETMFPEKCHFSEVQETFDIANCKIFQPLVRSDGVCVCD